MRCWMTNVWRASLIMLMVLPVACDESASRQCGTTTAPAAQLDSANTLWRLVDRGEGASEEELLALLYGIEGEQRASSFQAELEAKLKDWGVVGTGRPYLFLRNRENHDRYFALIAGLVEGEDRLELTLVVDCQRSSLSDGPSIEGVYEGARIIWPRRLTDTDVREAMKSNRWPSYPRAKTARGGVWE